MNVIILTNYVTNTYKNIIVQGLNTNNDSIISFAISNYMKSNSGLDTYKLIQLFLPIIGVIIGALVGYYVSKSHERRKFNRDVHLEFLKSINLFLYDVNDIITKIADINVLGIKLLNQNYNNYENDINDDYNLIMQRVVIFQNDLFIRKLFPQITNNPHNTGDLEILKNLIDDIRNFKLFQKIGSKLEKKAVNYLLLIDYGLKLKYENIINKLEIATNLRMKGMKLNNYKAKIIIFIKDINNKIQKYS
jgi:hypothetical protein